MKYLLIVIGAMLLSYLAISFSVWKWNLTLLSSIERAGIIWLGSTFSVLGIIIYMAIKENQIG